MSLKADPCLENDVADDKADPSVCLQVNQISVLQYFLETAGSMDHQHVLRQGVLATTLAGKIIATVLPNFVLARHL